MTFKKFHVIGRARDFTSVHKDSLYSFSTFICKGSCQANKNLDSRKWVI